MLWKFEITNNRTSYKCNRKFTLFSGQNCEDFIVLYPFCASTTDELTLTAGVIVSVIESKPSGWSWVTNVDVGDGWFPSQYLEPLNASLKRNNTKVECNVGILNRNLLKLSGHQIMLMDKVFHLLI